MDASRLVEMINLLIKRSKEGDLEWKSKRTLMGDGYACVVAGMQVMVMRHGPISTLGGARITVTTAEGLEIVSAAEGDFITGNAGGGVNALTIPVRLGAEIGQLFEVARSSANKSNAAIDSIIRELRKS